MKKAERLLDQIAFLLNARRPVTFAEIQNAFPEDYRDGQDESIARKFERDKADIIELGVPLRYMQEDEVECGGYMIDREGYSLPPIDLAPEEMAMLYLAGSAVLQMDGSPFSRDLVMALNKIGFATGEGEFVRQPVLRTMPANNLGDASALRRKEYLASLHRAISERKRTIIFYHSLWKDEKTKRDVDPYGLIYVQGKWFLVGYCHLREAMRVFHVDRITGLDVNRFKPKSPDFEFPKDFSLADHVARHPWEIKAHDPLEVKLRFEPPGAQAAVAELGKSVEYVEEDGEALIVRLSVTFSDGLLPTILWHRHRARVISPPEIVDKVKAALLNVAASSAAGGAG